MERGTQELRNLGNYIHLMGEHCKVPQGGGISDKTLYKNVYALCRWLNRNVLSVSNVSYFLQPSSTHCLHFGN